MHTELHSVHDMMEQLKARMEKVIQGAAGIEVDDGNSYQSKDDYEH